MKKIEEQIIKTFEKRCNDCAYSIQVFLTSRDIVEGYARDIVIYRLDDKPIFRYEPKKQRFSFSLEGYNTPTTRSRLRALLGYFCQAQLYMKQGKVFLETRNGKKYKIDTNVLVDLK